MEPRIPRLGHRHRSIRADSWLKGEPGASGDVWNTEDSQLPRGAYRLPMRATGGEELRDHEFESARRKISDRLHSTSRWSVRNPSLSSPRCAEDRHGSAR